MSILSDYTKSVLPEYKNMPLEKYPTMEEITEEISKEKERPDYVMTPEEKLEMAEQMERRTYRGHINLMMSWDDTVKALRKDAYPELGNGEFLGDNS